MKDSLIRLSFFILKIIGGLTMSDVNQLIQWFKNKEGKVSYSMINRNGPNSYDCSSAVFSGLIAAGFLPAGTWLGNTESLYKLEGSLLQPISRSEVRAGDIFVSGAKGGSSGAAGHTGVAISNSQIIHCTGGRGIITTAITDSWTGTPCHWYRLKGGSTAPVAPNTSGTWKTENGTFISNRAINLRTEASTSGKVISLMSAGSKIKYDAYKIDQNGYVWIRQKRENGYGYIATGESRNGKRIDYWGTFE